MGFITSLNKDDLTIYCLKQIYTFFPDNLSKYQYSFDIISKVMPKVLLRLEKCLEVINAPSYHDEQGNTIFYHLHADQYATFLYFLSNTIWLEYKEKILADKFMYLNRMLNGFFVSYKCNLPEHFYLSHPVGTVLGNADYGDYLVVLQNVTVNTGLNGGKKPKIGKGVILCAGCSIIGNEDIGDYVSVGVGTLVYKQYVPSNSTVKAKDGNLCVIEPRHGSLCQARREFIVDF